MMEKSVWKILSPFWNQKFPDSAILLLVVYPEKTSNSKRYMHPSVHISTIYNSLDMEAT